ncbi:hypothetical protein ACFQ08_21795 [Streptosporangium algeriense]|uniref:Uncharacterized protein n=1 Tax=Streptosporangium algeriense TaxID=1682748 RepID=A0ABW3DTK2_9ACTN
MIFHRCQYVPTAIQHVATALVVTGPGVTLVLQRCTQCSRHQVETLIGRWTAEQLQANALDGDREPV